MSVIADLIGKIRGKRAERFSSTAEAFDDCVRKLASGQEVDLDQLAGLLDELDKSDADLESDIENKQRRIAARAELDRLSQLSKDLPPKQAKIAKLQEELSSFIAAKKPVILALADEIKMLQLECDRASYIENELLTIGIPLALQNRKDALVKRQRTLSEKQDRYRDMTESSIRTKDALTVRLANVQSDIAKSSASHHTENLQRDCTELQRRIAQCESQIQNWEPLRLEISQEQSLIQSEQQSINRELMAP
jgi:hypothetical protein